MNQAMLQAARKQKQAEAKARRERRAVNALATVEKRKSAPVLAADFARKQEIESAVVLSFSGLHNFGTVLDSHHGPKVGRHYFECCCWPKRRFRMLCV